MVILDFLPKKIPALGATFLHEDAAGGGILQMKLTQSLADTCKSIN